MSEKLRELTNKIYKEGIEKAEQESSRIVNDARKEADSIKKSALEEKERLIAQTKSKMEAYSQKVEAEIKLAARKSINQIKQDLRNLITEKAIEGPIRKGLSDPATLTKVLVACMESIKEKKAGNWTFDLPESKKEEIQQLIEQDKHRLLSDNLVLKANKNLQSGFEVQPDGANYKIMFDDATFTGFLAEFLSVETQNLVNHSE